MKFKTLITLIILFSAVLVGKAETVSQQHAKSIAQQFFNAANGQYMAEPKMVYNGRRLTTQRLFVPFYVYNHPAGGFVIVSADNKAYPILAYSLKDSFDPDHIGDKLKSLLTGYAYDIERIRYDDRIPYDAIEAWNDIRSYINEILTSPQTGDDLLMTVDESSDMVERVYENDAYNNNWSYLYSPEQWSELINEELDKNRNIALGLITPQKDVLPVIIQNRRGDYYRIRTDIPDEVMYRLFATEYISDGQLAMLDYAPGNKLADESDFTYNFVDDFIAETQAEGNTRAKDIEESLSFTVPVLHVHGGGNYSVDLPEEAAMARVFNLSGALVRQYTYGQTSSPHVEIIAEPTGFYLLQIIAKSGNTYGFKIVR